MVDKFHFFLIFYRSNDKSRKEICRSVDTENNCYCTSSSNPRSTSMPCAGIARNTDSLLFSRWYLTHFHGLLHSSLAHESNKNKKINDVQIRHHHYQPRPTRVHVLCVLNKVIAASIAESHAQTEWDKMKIPADLLMSGALLATLHTKCRRKTSWK